MGRCEGEHTIESRVEGHEELGDRGEPRSPILVQDAGQKRQRLRLPRSIQKFRFFKLFRPPDESQKTSDSGEIVPKTTRLMLERGFLGGKVVLRTMSF